VDPGRRPGRHDDDPADHARILDDDDHDHAVDVDHVDPRDLDHHHDPRRSPRRQHDDRAGLDDDARADHGSAASHGR